MTPTAVLLTVLGYIAMLFVVAGIAGRRVSNTGFFTGNRENPWYVAALAMVGAAMSGITFVSVPGSVAADSFSYLQMVLGFTVGQMVIAFVLIPLFYRLKVVSLYEYLDGRFGMTTHLTGAWFFFISKMFAAALKVYVVCTVLQVLVFDPFGVPFAVNAAFLVGLVWLYTWRGGVRSVVWTDILHTCCLVGSIVLCIVFIMRSLGLTSAGVVQAVCDSPMSRIFFFEDAGSARYFWKMFFGGVFTLVAMTGLDQDMMQRNLSCRSPWDSQINIVITEEFLYFKEVANTTETAGGSGEESDTAYYNRMRESEESYTTAGPRGSYIYHAKAVSSQISDVSAESPQDGVADIRIMLYGGELPSEELIKEVQAYLSADDIRPMTDKVTVAAPTTVDFDIELTYYIPKDKEASTKEIKRAVDLAVESYELWQTSKMGRDINPSYFYAILMDSGIKRADIKKPVFTEIPKGSVAVLKKCTVTFGGVEDE